MAKFQTLFFILFAQIALSQNDVNISIDVNSKKANEKLLAIFPKSYYFSNDTFDLTNALKNVNLPISEIQILLNSDKIFSQIETKDEASIHYYNLSEKPITEGKSSKKMLFIDDFYKKFPTLTNYESDEIERFSVDAYENKIFSEMKLQMEYLEKDTSFKKFNENTQRYLYNIVKYNYLDRLLFYAVRENLSLEIKYLPNIMLDLVKPNLIDNKSSLYIDKYRSFLDKYITFSAFKDNNFTNFKDKNSLVEQILSSSYSNLKNEIRTYFIAKTLCQNSELISKEFFDKYNKLISLDAEYKTYEKPISAVLLKNKFFDITKDKKTVKAKSDTLQNAENKAYELIFYTEKGKEVKLSDFKGKVVYVDVWASWCSPCRRQFPFSLELQEKFTAKEKSKIVFLYISIDENEEAWKKASETMQIHGVNVIAKGGWKSSIISHFKIQGIPRCLLIDKNGNVVDENAKKPSQTEEIYKEIKTLIEK